MTDPHESERPAEAGRFARDFAIGVVLLAFCVAAYWITLGFKQAPAALAQNVQPATFPRLVIAVIAVLTVAMMLLGLREREPKRAMPRPAMIVTATAMIGFVLAFEMLGVLASIGLFCLVMPVMWGARPSWRLVVFAIGFPTAVYLVFAVGLDVYFPPGVVEQAFARLS